MRRIIECIPNVSEGRNKSVINSLRKVIEGVHLVRLLDVHSDPDHNRSVFTFIGPPHVVKRAAYKLTEKAIELIDIEKHEGVHPFIGAVDVIPFVPLIGVSTNETVELARGLGDEIAHSLKIPVYFYGSSALRHDRHNLPAVRHGGYQALKEEIASPERQPDYGPEELHPRGGAVAIGVRDFLIAFNVNLDSDNLDAAKEIARAIREKHGGLPGVRAIGVTLESKGLVQVSMNITDHRETTLKEVMDFVIERAKRKGIAIKEGEIVGMIPKDAIFPNIKGYLKLPRFVGSKIVNNYL